MLEWIFQLNEGFFTGERVKQKSGTENTKDQLLQSASEVQVIEGQNAQINASVLSLKHLAPLKRHFAILKKDDQTQVSNIREFKKIKKNAE